MRRTLQLLIALTTAALCATVLTAVGSPATAAPRYTVQTLHFKTKVGPTGQVCDVIGDLYLPRAASRKNKVPAILTSNGFGGSKNDQAGIGKSLSSRGYAVLSYSGLGFGGSGCKVSLDDPDWDGLAGQQLVSYLGGAPGIAYLDARHTRPAPTLQVIRRDRRAHDGKVRRNDPRVGTIGGSYGGQNQFAIAGKDPRVDTIVPIITWNDLSYSLGPNNAGPAKGVSSSVPGVVKLTWGLGFSALGMVNGLQNAQVDPARLLGCPNFVTFVCPALVTAGATGFFQPDAIAKLRHASASAYLKKIRIPVFLWQGQADTLFNLNEAIATYRTLKAQGTPVKMIWQSWGHSNSRPRPGELDMSALNPKTQYQASRVINWFDHYLKGRKVSTGPEFAYFRNWIRYTGNARPAYATASRFPVGTRRSYYLSGKALTTAKSALARASQSFLTPAAGLPTRLEPADAIGAPALMEDDLPGTFASWQTGVLRSARNVVGSPVLRLKVDAPLAALSQISGPAGKLVLFIRLQDVGPNGAAKDIELQTAPVRVNDVNKAFTVTLPAMVHRFGAGHRIRLVVAGGSLNYRGGLTANPVSIATGSAAQVLTLPEVR